MRHDELVKIINSTRPLLVATILPLSVPGAYSKEIILNYNLFNWLWSFLKNMFKIVLTPAYRC
jgi:hypothetical protein